jgi:hypothetical protein
MLARRDRLAWHDAGRLIVGPKANAIAIAKAKVAGSGWVAVRSTDHCG